MTHEETSMQTKTMFCTSLKKLLKTKPFSKITVSELIKDCNVNRKTFYYHFEDIYALLTWMLEQEAIEIVKQADLLVDFRDTFYFVVDYVEQNSFILNCIYDSVGRDVLKKFFYQDCIGIVDKLVRDTEEQLNVTIEDDFRCFLSNLYCEGIAGMLINLFQHPEQYDKDKLYEYFTIIIHTSLPAVLRSQN